MLSLPGSKLFLAATFQAVELGWINCLFGGNCSSLIVGDFMIAQSISLIKLIRQFNNKTMFM